MGAFRSMRPIASIQRLGGRSADCVVVISMSANIVLLFLPQFSLAMGPNLGDSTVRAECELGAVKPSFEIPARIPMPGRFPAGPTQ